MSCISYDKGAFPGSKCIPYVPASKPFDGAPDLLAKEQERKVAHVEAIIGTKEELRLTDHAKYCRLSKQPGGLCVRARDGSFCVNPSAQYTDKMFIFDDFIVCPMPQKQQPVELPKDPLEELIKAYTKDVYECYEIYNIIEIERVFREFAEKVRALK
jgi:hypothetical protein